jgi:hypothetical protein
MADLGPDNLLVNAIKVRLKIGADEFVQVTNIQPHFGRPEFREPLTDGGVRYFYGSGDHWFEATITGTTDQISALNAKTELDILGNTPTTNYTIEATSRDGTVSSITVPAFLRDFNLEAPEEGFLEFRCFFRITTDTITVN